MQNSIPVANHTTEESCAISTLALVAIWNVATIRQDSEVPMK